MPEFAEHHDGGVRHHHAEDEVERLAAYAPREVGAGHGAGRGSQLEHHGDPKIGQPVPHVGDGRSARGRDHRYDGGADRITDVYVEPKRERRNDQKPAAKPKQGAEGPGDNRDHEREKDEEERRHGGKNGGE
jgi:hypothetical protein